ARAARPPGRHAHHVRGRHRQGAGRRDHDRGSAAGDGRGLMPLYRYKALNARGEVLDGQMEAGSDREVAQRLQEQGHLPMEARLASEGGGGGAWRALFKPKPFAGQRLVQFTQQLATLLGAGQPLDRALTILLELPEDEAAKRAIADIRDAVRGGSA